MAAAQKKRNTPSEETGGSATNHAEEKEIEKQKKKDQANLKRAERLQKYVNTLSNSSEKVENVLALLAILLPYLKIVMAENKYRYTLGLIYFRCPITNRQLMSVAHCSKRTLDRGKREVREGIIPDFTRKREKGAGRTKTLTAPEQKAILKYVRLRSYGPCTKGMQEYTAATLDSIQGFLMEKLHKKVSRSTIQAFLKEQGIRLRTNKKLLYGNQNTETQAQKAIRHSQFDLIYQMLGELNNPNYIQLFMDCKKKEYLGEFSCAGVSYSFKGEEVKVDDHSFFKPLKVATLKDRDDLENRMEGKAIPFGFYDIVMKKAYISVGISHDTPEFIAKSLLNYIDRIKKDHPTAKYLVLYCDGGGSNNARSHVFKKYMEELSTIIGMKIIIVHYPPYRSKFNKIERHVFAPISKKFERSVLYNLNTVLALINNTTTKTGLTCVAELDVNVYETGIKITDEEYNAINITYLLAPNGVNTHLAYIIDGTGKSTDYLDKKPLTVFEVKQNIDLTKEEKEQLAREKKERKQKQQQANASGQKAKNKQQANSQKAKTPAPEPECKKEKVTHLPI